MLPSPTMGKTVYLIIGPKGSGKTSIGTYIHETTDIHFLPVEPIWLTLRDNECGWQKVLEAVEHCLLRHEKVMVENLGAGEGFNAFLTTLQARYRTRLIKVETDLDRCFERVKSRNGADHIPVSDDQVREYNHRAAQVALNWDLIIDNNGHQPVNEIIEKIGTL